MPSVWLVSLLGGLLIGLASALLALTHGRIAGISGITGSLLVAGTSDRGWRLAFVAGLLAAGLVATLVAPHAVELTLRSLPLLILSGLLVGFGTRLGNGCTSGHGVCGLARLSPRSLVAVLVFMMTGAITVLVTRGVS
jgi:uncharacterized protein